MGTADTPAYAPVAAADAAVDARARASEAWPSLPLGEWQPTLDTLHRWTQLVGKTKLALAPPVNHWWHVTLHPTARGLGTGPMPAGDRVADIELDFVDHNLLLRTNDGHTRALALVPRTVAAFYREYLALLESSGIRARIRPYPVEVVDARGFAEDEAHHDYDAAYAHRMWRVLSRIAPVMERFRGRFLGKASPVHFFWGSFDLACTRFNGRRAPTHSGGVPNCPDYVMWEAYSHECISAGWWPGGGAVAEPAFYAYAYPEPPGFAERPVQPEAAYYNTELRELVLPYEAVRTAADPEAALTSFLQSSYEAAAELLGWD
ncbi:MAG TPA: DUF5996 family protein, partial [Gemmatimonadaceae bacterium]|nr:DUF5996 family protein [Gemmatimonadaceae bacterium]